MKVLRFLGLGVVGACTCVPAVAFGAAVSLGDFGTIATGVGAQAAMFIGDVAPLLMVVVGAGLFILITGAIISMVTRH